MKVFIGAVTVLALEIAVIVIACFYVSSLTEELLFLADSLPTEERSVSDDALTTATEMERVAESKGRYLFLFVNHNEWEALTSKITEVRTRLETESFEDYLSNLTELKYELAEFKESEGFSVKSIL